MLDTIIRAGTILDGTGAAPRSGDVGIVDGRIVAVGERLSGSARQIIDAGGALVTPGFIDIHTHYDGQLLWDTVMDPSFSNGVTTAIAGNCGVGFAPARAQHRRQLMEMMEGVEDIPGIVLDVGLDWRWRSFPDYLERIAARHYTMDVGVGITHAPLRVYVMGERALAHEPATDADIAEMAQQVRAAMAAGAMGFSAGRIAEHFSSRGDNIPGTFSDARELLAIARAMGEKGTGVFQLVPRGAAGTILGTGSSRAEREAEHELMVDIARVSGRPVTYVSLQLREDPDEWFTMLHRSERAHSQGMDIRPQVSARQIGLLLTLDGYHIFQCRPSYMAISHLPRAERALAMRAPQRRAAILREADVPVEQAPRPQIHGFAVRFKQELATFYAFSNPLDYEPPVECRLDQIAARTGCSMEEVLYDLLISEAGNGIAGQFAYNYAEGNLDATHSMLNNPRVLSGLGDGGAHLLLSCDGAMPTFQLSFWGRDRKRGPKLPLEMLIRRLTKDGADFYSLSDRGTLAPGKRADVNVIDFAALSVKPPRMHFDLPEGGGRLLQQSTGYLATLVNGTITRRFDTDTGLRPGRLVRPTAQTSL